MGCFHFKKGRQAHILLCAAGRFGAGVSLTESQERNRYQNDEVLLLISGFLILSFIVNNVGSQLKLSMWKTSGMALNQMTINAKDKDISNRDFWKSQRRKIIY